MEFIELYDPSVNKLLKVKVPSAIAEKCRKNPEFAQALFEEIQKENIQDGSVLDVATSDLEDEDSPSEATNDPETPKAQPKDTWSKEESRKFFVIMKKYKLLFNSKTNKDVIWKTVSKELASVGINKDVDECKDKWEKGEPENESQQASIDDSQMESADSDGDAIFSLPKLINSKPPQTDRAPWTHYETLKLLKVYQTLKFNWKFPKHDKRFWVDIANELAEEGIQKNYKQCESKLKNLQQSYKNAQRNGSNTSFMYQQQMEDLKNDVELENPRRVKDEDTDEEESQTEEDDSQDAKRSKMEDEMKNEQVHFAQWSNKQTSKLIEAFKKHKNRFKLSASKEVWKLISAELAKDDMIKDPDKCRNKWVCLKRAYDQADPSKKFKFADEIRDALGSDADRKRARDDSDDDAPPDRKSVRNGHPEDSEWEGETGAKGPSWSQLETIALVQAYREHRETNELADKSVDWQEISMMLGSKGIRRTSGECQNEWLALYKGYMTDKLGESEFAFRAEMDEVFKTEAAATEIKVGHCQKCRCCEKMADKQKRHTERMNLLKTRLDVEKRKVLAFEKYLNTLSS